MPLLFIVIAFLLAIAFVPLLFFLRFRIGSGRRRGRRWLASLNVFLLGISAVLLLVSAAIINMWVPDTLRSAAIGLACGALLSLFGLVLTHWQQTPDAVFYKPNRWFALLVPLALTVRVLYWLWRGAHQWGTSADARSWLALSGTAGSLGVGAAVAGYYFGYAIGVWQRIDRYKSP